MPFITPKPWIVQKYGGTSIGKLLPEITGSIIPAYLKDYQVAVVCSARSGSTKSRGTTSLLLEAIHLATSREDSTEDLDQVLDIIKEEHFQAAREAVVGGDVQESYEKLSRELQASIEADCESLRKFLKAAWTIGELSERSQDRVLAVGEKLACRIVAASLQSKGIRAKVVVLDDIVQQAYSQGIREQKSAFRRCPREFLAGLTETLRARLFDTDGAVPIITGFFGAMPESLVSSVGRGYSDLCAALCAVAISAQELQIWKEVDGIFTADPSKVKSARLLATVTSEEAAELTYYGSEVIHPLTIEQISGADIPLRLKNVKNPDGSGTIIYPSISAKTSPSLSLSSPAGSDTSTPRSVFMTANGYHGESQYRRSPTAVTAKSVAVLNVRSNGRTRPQDFLGDIGQRLGRHDLTVDLISSSQQLLSLAVSVDSAAKEVDSLGEAVKDLDDIGIATTTRHMSIISIVGHKMRNVVGVAAEIFAALAEARINIYLISQGASEINISFVVKAQDTLLALNIVHTNVMRIPQQSEQENSFIKGPWLY
ncbi:aspartate kinase [Aulographum hederae CBS 113979]|uniref:Aspartokinase n=1 Tax=Aulographum hederae CBS 113979 TaxID=1176131 RepID=A0A6G1GXY1_9PEZI|nr:aspartate kinase [Aulographum hederae CBS 113979]